MSVTFDPDKYYNSGEWKIAVNPASSHYEKLGFRFVDSPTDQQIKEAFFKRDDWWQQKDKISRSGKAHPYLKEVGPFIQDAIKNLTEAKSILSDSVKKAQYDKRLKDETIRKAEEELIKYIDFALKGDNQISDEEKSNLLNMADTLHIHRDRAEEIIIAAMARTGATFRSEGGSSASTNASTSFDAFLNKTYYEVLGITDDADYAQIKEAYDREHEKYIKAKDKAKASARFYVVSEAWDCLKDPVKRREYDEKLKQPKTSVPTGTPRLVVECKTDYTFRDIRRGEIINVDKIVIKNPEGGLLRGAIKSDVPWLEPDRNKILEKHEQELYINILSSKVPVNTYDTKGTITIDTNGGPPYLIPFRVILEGLEIAADRFRKTYVPLVAACAGFVGSFGDSPFLNFLAGVFFAGIVTYAFAKLFVKFFLNKGIDIFKVHPVLIQGAAAGVIILTIVSHSGGGSVLRSASYTPAPAPAPAPAPIEATAPAPAPIEAPAPALAPAPETPSMNITKAIVAAGVDTNQIPFGIDTSFPSGIKRLYYYLSYNGGIPDSTVFVFKWYKYGDQISENQFTIKYASGNVWNYLDYDFQSGQYEAQVYANGQQLGRTSFNVSASSADIQREEQRRAEEERRQREAAEQQRQQAAGDRPFPGESWEDYQRRKGKATSQERRFAPPASSTKPGGWQKSRESATYEDN